MLPGQQPLVRVNIAADPPTARLWVDGQAVSSPYTANWEAGSRHTFSTDRVQDFRLNTRYRFLRWEAASAVASPLSETTEVVASPSVTSYRAVFATEYAVSIVLYQCMPETAGMCTQPGTLAVNGKMYTASASVYVPTGSNASLLAVAGKDHAFSGWGALPGISGQGPSITLPVNAPVTVTPQFKPTSGVEVGIYTEPAGLKVMADGVELATSTKIEWPWFSDHVLSTAPIQRSPDGRWWVFRDWSDGGAATHTVSIRNGVFIYKYVARFSPGLPVDVVTSPLGLKLIVDKAQECTDCSFVWALSSTHTLAAPAEPQLDAKGLSFRFRRWDNDEPGPLYITIDDTDPSQRMRRVGFFDALGKVNIDTQPQGVRIRVGDTQCTTPCRLQKPLGSSFVVSAPASYTTTAGARLDFVAWADDATASRTLTATNEAQSLTATYKQMNPLVAAAHPPAAGTFEFTPASPDGYYETATRVSVTASARPGYRFDHWEGDLGGAAPSGSVLMNGRRQVSAVFEAVPWLPEKSVTNAATDIHGNTVAACSLVSISGVNLTATEERSSEYTPRQYLAGVGVRMGETNLGLYIASPEQIQAVLPCDLPDGLYSLGVTSGDRPELITTFAVARNAPGLFTTLSSGTSWAVADHEDGGAITTESPARAGELVTLYGTGFGPLQAATPDGFSLPENRLVDPAEVLIGDEPIQPEFAGSASGRPGFNTIRFRVPMAGNTSLKVRINGVDSNEAVLPVAQQ